MSRIDENRKSVRFSSQTDIKLALLASKLARTKRDLIVQMIDYFYKSKKDPADLNDELLKKELSSGVSRILAFIQKQESDLLVPIFQMNDEASNLVKVDVSLSNKILENQSRLGTLLLEQKKGLLAQGIILESLMKGLSSNQQLKIRFREILEYYISEREMLGWPVSAQKKEELAKKVRLALEKF